MVKLIAATVLAVVVGCGTFQDPDVVVDLRVLAITGTPPQQVVDVDQSQQPIDLLAQLVPATVCGLVTDPGFDRRLHWKMTMCNLGEDGRCDAGNPFSVLGEGLLDDPDTTSPAPTMCAPIPVDGNLLGILVDILDSDPLMGLGGIDYGIELRVGGEGEDPELDIFGDKQLEVAPRIPASRTANTNPTISGLTVSIDGGTPAPLPLQRCADIDPVSPPLVVSASQKVRFEPIEPDGIRETYVVPTLDGKTATFTESITYQWVTGGGSYSNDSTGGPHDTFGNPAPLFTDWTSPSTADITETTDVPIWIIQRDERFGAAWFETCVRVTDP